MKIYRAVKTNFITQKFGKGYTFPALLSLYQSMGLRGHNGFDFVASDSEPVYWDTDGRGKVIETSIDGSGGLGVVIISEDNGQYYKHRFWHLKEFKCHAGQTVESGDLLGLADNTGMSTGTHLHRDLKRCDINGVTLNKDNGYLGCIDITPYFNNIYVVDYVRLLKLQVSLLAQIVKKLQEIFNLKRSKETN